MIVIRHRHDLRRRVEHLRDMATAQAQGEDRTLSAHCHLNGQTYAFNAVLEAIGAWEARDTAAEINRDSFGRITQRPAEWGPVDLTDEPPDPALDILTESPPGHRPIDGQTCWGCGARAGEVHPDTCTYLQYKG